MFETFQTIINAGGYDLTDLTDWKPILRPNPANQRNQPTSGRNTSSLPARTTPIT